ncbi:MAG: nucleotide exchange factor GrpE [Planctomycetota bacterium]|jgi:molecular chaperone GrpE (heat shock protein)
MNKIFVIIGLVFLIAGSAMYGWIHLEKKKEQQRIANYKSKPDSGTAEFIEQFRTEGYDKSKFESQQHDRLQADLDELASGEKNISLDADILYGENWQDELQKYKKRKELSEFILTSSIVCISMGGTVYLWYLLVWFIKVSVKAMTGLKKRLQNVNNKQPKEDNEETGEIFIEKDLIEKEQEHEQPPKDQQNHLKKDTKAPWSASKNKSKQDKNEKTPLTKQQSGTDKTDHKHTKKHVEINATENAEKIAVLLSDEETTDSLAKLEDSLKAQTEQLEERTTQSVQEALKEHSKPLDSTLKDLAQQVSAIREYASCQQERVEKLQDGYDWNIIKTFCLRIIRCIDNLENRIERLSSKGTKTEYLEDIRDEMVFALESSGIEQYQPEINSDYRGQEKYAEAVKQKEHCDNSKQKGKIAKVIRPGYQYVINEENIKIVRTAQVKLFG